MNLRLALAIMKKDLLDALRNARLLVVVLLPIGFSVLYGYLFRDTATNIEIVLYSPGPSELAERLAGMRTVSLFVVAAPEQLETMLSDEAAALAIELPADFDRALRDGIRPSVELLVGRDEQDARRAQQLILLEIGALSGRPPLVDFVEKRPSAATSESEREAAADQSLFEGLSLQAYFVVLWVMMGITMNGTFLVPTLLVEEKEKRTLDAILVAPPSYADVVLGKMVVGLIYSLLSAFAVMAVNDGFQGDIALSLALVVLASIALALIGLLIGGLIDNLTSLNTWSTFIMLPLMLPGLLAAIPLGMLGGVLRTIMQIVPTYQVVQGLSLSLSGKGVETAGSLAVLAFECGVLFVLVLWSLRRREA